MKIRGQTVCPPQERVLRGHKMGATLKTYRPKKANRFSLPFDASESENVS